MSVFRENTDPRFLRALAEQAEEERAVSRRAVIEAIVLGQARLERQAAERAAPYVAKKKPLAIAQELPAALRPFDFIREAREQREQRELEELAREVRAIDLLNERTDIFLKRLETRRSLARAKEILRRTEHLARKK